VSVPAEIIAARNTAARVMDSTCTITRDVEGTQDDWWDPVTGQIVSGTGDSSSVYEGPCMIRPASSRRGSEVEASATMWEQLYRVRIGVGAAAVQRGDTVTITACPADPQMVGRQLRVSEAEGGTYAVTRILECTVKERGYEQ
jgi:hypothetical protein